MQNIKCKSGVCVDQKNLSCDERYSDIVDIIRCEVEEQNHRHVTQPQTFI